MTNSWGKQFAPPPARRSAWRGHFATFAVFLSATQVALAADPDPEHLLRLAFDNYRANTSRVIVSMTIHRPDWERGLQMKAWTRGDDDALVRFVAPPKDAGNATLKSATDTWMFNPRLNQVIKLPASMMSQSWMGSDFSYNDLSKSEEILTQFTHRVAATANEAGHTAWTIDCIPKPGAPIVWGKVTVILRDDYVITKETFFDQDMKPARIMTTDRIGPLAGRMYPLAMTMHPSDAPGSWTRIDTSSAEFDLGVPGYIFTLSNLQNPRN